jgi:hypothetical protein
MRVTEAAAYMGMSPDTLNKKRCTGGGPRFTKRGRMVFYNQVWCDEWQAQGTASSTSEYGHVGPYQSGQAKKENPPR